MHSKGIIFNIQKFSIHDGPGIRTTIFLKGCPLQCKWCSNPESQDMSIQILVDKKKCTQCLQCVHTCPVNAISLVENHIEINHNTCIQCLNCTTTCPNTALQIEGEYKEVDEIVKIVLQDKAFYEESGGGVTLSGGEPLLQLDFVKSLVLELKRHHLHVAVETTGYVPHASFKEIAPLFDLLLFDVKHYDSLQHHKGTGVNNDLIINNLTWAIVNQIPILPRIPVIPRFNATIEDAKSLAKLLKKAGASTAQLLPFHQFGENKYAMLNREYSYQNDKALYKEDLIEYQKEFIKQGIDCFF